MIVPFRYREAHSSMKYSEVFPCRDCCRCFGLSLLFIHNVSGLPVIVAGGLWQSRPHSYLTLGPLHHLAHSQKHTVSERLSQQPPYSDSAGLMLPSLHRLSPARTKAAGNCSASEVKPLSGRNRLSRLCCELLNDVSQVNPFIFTTCAAAEFGEEVADELFLCGRVSRQLSAVGVVGLVGLFSDLRTRR